MKTRLLLSLPVVAAMTLSANAAGFFDNFDSYAPGSNLHGQGGWKGWDNTPGAGALVSTAQAYSPNNSVNISGPSDLVHQFSGYTSGQWILTVNQFIPRTSQGETYFILLNAYNDGGPYNWSVQLNQNLTTGIVNDEIGTGSANLVKDAWVPWKFVIDLTADKVSQYYNGNLISTHPWKTGTGSVGALAAIDLYANNAGPVYYDDLRIAVVPEPGTLALLGLGALALALRRRK